MVLCDHPDALPGGEKWSWIRQARAALDLIRANRRPYTAAQIATPRFHLARSDGLREAAQPKSG